MSTTLDACTTGCGKEATESYDGKRFCKLCRLRAKANDLMERYYPNGKPSAEMELDMRLARHVFEIGNGEETTEDTLPLLLEKFFADHGGKVTRK